MPVISIRVSDQQYSRLEDKAKAEGIKMAEYIIKQLFPGEETGPSVNELLDKVQTDIDGLTPGKKFSIPDFFTSLYWHDLPKGTRLNLGRAFKERVDANELSMVEFVEKTSTNLAVYRKKE